MLKLSINRVQQPSTPAGNTTIYLNVRDCNSHQKLLQMHHKMKQIAIITSTKMKPTARKQPQPSKKYKEIPYFLDKTERSLAYSLNGNNNGKLPYYGAISNIVASY